MWKSLLDQPGFAGEQIALAEDDRETGLETLRERNFLRILDLVEAHVAPGRRKLLDVGCGHGWFLSAAKARAFDSTGLEPDAPVANRARAKGHEVRVGYFPDDLAQGESWDVIVFNDTFEHLPQPAEAMAACTRMLGPDGVLVLNLPTSRGMLFRVGDVLSAVGVGLIRDRLWQRGFPSPHLYYWNERTLRNLATRSNLELLDTRPLPSIELDGLWPRLRMDPRVSRLKALVLFTGLAVSYPVLRWLAPSDILVQVYRKRG